MKNKIVVSMLVFILISIYSKISGYDRIFYYNSKYEKIEITKIFDKVIVQLPKETKKEVSMSTFSNLLSSEGLIPKDYVIENINSKTFIVRGSNQKLEALRYSNVQTVYTMYLDNNGDEIGIADEICIKFKPEVSEQQKSNLLNSLRLKIKKSFHFGDILIVSEKDKTLEVANKFFETGLVHYSQPNFLVKITPYGCEIPNDTYFNKQFNLHNTGQVINDGHTGLEDADVDAPEAWQITKGSSDIIIAIIDEGVTANHPDLPSNRQIRLPGSDIYSDDNDPSPEGDSNHGNACAGIAAGTQNNNQGISGIAPNCKIMPIRVRLKNVKEYIVVSDCAEAIEFAWDNGADVISCSWGFKNEYDVIETAIENAIDLGRQIGTISYGCVVVCAAGNTAEHSQGDDGYVEFPARITSVPGVIAVGASDRYDQQSDYSPTSTSMRIDVVAPSHRAYYDEFYMPDESFEIWSMDIPGEAGDNPGKSDNYPHQGEVLPDWGTNYLSYTGRMGGTSAACPLVAGIAALVLSLNPTLRSWDCEVLDIITETADKVGGYDYHNNTLSAEMGWGRVNAFRAVIEASGSLVLQNDLVNIGETETHESPHSIFVAGDRIDIPRGGGTYYTVKGNGTSGGNVTLRAAKAIFFDLGFTVEKGGTFYAYIDPSLGGGMAKRVSSAKNNLLEDDDNIKSNNEDSTEVCSKVLPDEYTLSNNYPNPFNPTTTIKYVLKEEIKVTIKIYNILGKEITTLVNETQPAGYQSVIWNGTDH
ncbi:MAG: S8 family serine peptidase, partial [Bacteroidales bacterium]|nr:S8 family serine peptidase [Bacteroidales bacterium]